MTNDFNTLFILYNNLPQNPPYVIFFISNFRKAKRALPFAALLVQSAVYFALGHRNRLPMRLLISSLKSIVNAFLYGQLGHQILF